jgi:hypothetical protein
MHFANMVPAAPVMVAVGDDKFEVKGIKASGLGHLVFRFRGLAAIDVTKAKDGNNEALVMALLDLGDEFVAAIIAAGVGHAGDAEAEGWASKLSLSKQIEFIAAILTLTMPDGIDPLVASVRALTGALKAAPKVVSVEAPAKIRGRKSA